MQPKPSTANVKSQHKDLNARVGQDKLNQLSVHLNELGKEKTEKEKGGNNNTETNELKENRKDKHSKGENTKKTDKFLLS